MQTPKLMFELYESVSPMCQNMNAIGRSCALFRHAANNSVGADCFGKHTPEILWVPLNPSGIRVTWLIGSVRVLNDWNVYYSRGAHVGYLRVIVVDLDVLACRQGS